MATKPTLSREYMYVPIEDMNVVAADLVVNGLAFMTAGAEPEEADWQSAMIVDTGDPLFNADIGDSLVLLVGPTRGDSVTTLDLTPEDYQVWVDVAVTGSDERIVRIAGTLEVSATGGA